VVVNCKEAQTFGPRAASYYFQCARGPKTRWWL